MTTHATRQNESTMDKIKDKLHIGSHGNTTNDTYNTGGTAEGVSGPHGTRTANALDPRVDSDRDNSRTVGNTTGYGSGTGYGTTGGVGTGGYGTSGATAEGVSGPHGTRTANALDPRVDSDRDNSATLGYGSTGTTGYGSASGGTAGYTTGGRTGTAEGVSGPHGSRVANALDPRVDSDRDQSATVGGGGRYGNATGPGNGYGTTTGTNTGFAGGMSNSTNAGPHDSNVANKLDPRVDSDLDGRGNRHGANTGGVFGASGSHATPGSGTAQNTAGPHNNDLANKLDPRVDSDRDNSTTLGGNRTYA